MTAGRHVDRTHEPDTLFRAHLDRWETADTAPEAWEPHGIGLDGRCQECDVTAAPPPEPGDWLNHLDALREAATPGPWTHEHDDYGDEWWFGGARGGGQEVIAGHVVTDHGHAADAALIVAAVNALGPLVGALRAVLDRHRPVSQNVYAATPLRDPVDVCAIDTTAAYPCQTVRAIESALAAVRRDGNPT